MVVVVVLLTIDNTVQISRDTARSAKSINNNINELFDLSIIFLIFHNCKSYYCNLLEHYE